MQVIRILISVFVIIYMTSKVNSSIVLYEQFQMLVVNIMLPSGCLKK